MAENELEYLEKYIFSEDRQEALKLFPSSSNFKKYLELNHLLSTSPQDPTINLLLESFPNHEQEMIQRLRTRHLLKQYDTTQDPEVLNKLSSDLIGNPNDWQAPRSIQSEEIETFPSHYKINLPSLSEAATTDKLFSTLTELGKLQIDISQTSDSIFKKLLSRPDLWKYENLSQRFLVYFQNNKGFTETECFKSMSRQQLKEISNGAEDVWKNGSFIRAWLRKEYFLKIGQMKNDEKYEFLKFVAAEVLADTRLPDVVRTVALLNVLNQEVTLGIIDEVWFFKYLSYHRPSEWYIDSTIADKSYSSYEQFLIAPNLNENSLLGHFVPALLFKDFSLLEKFQNLFRENYIESIVAKTKILKGIPLQDNEQKYLSNALVTSVELEPSPSNQKQFTRSEVVSFSMHIKNVPRLIVKVLELNPKNYFLKNFKNIDSNITLDGLIPSFEYSFEYNTETALRSVQKFDFPELTGKVGVFVIEFFGNGRQSRVIIKKGSLRYVAKATIAGHLVYVLNEDNVVCKTGGIYLDSKLYEANAEDGRIHIPFGRVVSTKPLVLFDGEICELVSDFCHLNEQYELKTAFLINKEQLVARTSCKFFIKPTLFVNGVKAPSCLMTQCKATIVTKDIENVESNKYFNDLQVPDDSSAIELNFEVPLNLKTVNISFDTVVENTEGEKLNLSSNDSLLINHTLGSTDIINSAFLTKINEEFVIQIKGLTGEPVINQRLEVNTKHKFWNSDSKSLLQTDSNGQVYLGALENISTITLQLKKDDSRPEVYNWDISKYTGTVFYPQKIRLCEGDEFSLPVLFPSFEQLSQVLWFYSEQENIIVDTLTDKLNYIQESSSLLIKDLEAGNYTLAFKTGENIVIEILEGSHLGPHFIVQENSAVETSEDYMTIGINSIKATETEVEVKISGKFNDESIVYGLFFNHFSEDLLKIYQSLLALNYNSPTKIYSFSTPQNLYLPSTKLDEEYQYVLDRKKHQRFVGSTLDKPQILLKRFFVTSTVTETQRAKCGEAFERMDLCNARMASMSRKCAERRETLRVGQSIPVDFLLNPALLMDSKVKEGVSKFKIPGHYYNFIAFAYNSVGSAYKLINLHQNIPVRDLRLQNSAKDSTEVYKSQAVFQGETLKINDFSSTTLEIFDSFSRLHKLITTLAKTNNPSIDLECVNVFAEWYKFSFEKKKEIFDKFVSHELNLFIHKRDPKFFNEVVLPFLQCKMQKDFIDKYLCGFDLSEYASFKLHNLDYFQKALLVDNIKHKNREFAVAIVNWLKDLANGTKMELKVRTHLIRRVLLSNSADNSKGYESEDDDYVGEEEEGGGGGEEREECQAEMMNYGDSNDFLDINEDDEPRSRTKSTKKSDMGKVFDQPKGIVREAMLLRSAPKTYYKKLDETKEFKETYYYKNPSSPYLSNCRLFAELAESFLNEKSWFSESIIYNTENSFENAIGLTYSAVEFKPNRQNIAITGNEWTLTATSPALVFYKELGKSEIEPNPLVFMGCNYYENNSDQEVKQFVKEKVYKCNYTITNTTSGNLNLTVLTQIPEGSIALKPEIPSKTNFLSLKSYTTKCITIYFYFPYSGIFSHIPGNIAVNSKICTFLTDFTIKVQDKYEVTNLESFGDLVISGRKELILEYLEKENLLDSTENFSLIQIYWMMKNKDFWTSVLNIYRKKLIFEETLWQFAFYHKDPAAISEYLSMNTNIKAILGYFFKSSLISTNDEGFKHTEFDPLVNARAYRLGDNQRITNTRFKEVYTDYLKFLSEKPDLTNSDLICLSQYLIYQERYQEAKSLYSKINLKPSKDKAESNELQIQYDYLTCYLDLDQAKTIAPLYENHPVPTWHKLFKEVRVLLQEIDSEDKIIENVKKPESSLSFVVENDSIELQYENVQSCVIRIYEIDLEILFSKTPFLIKDVQSFSYVKPNIQIDLELSSTHQSYSLEKFKGKNVLIEVDYKTSSAIKSYFSHLLAVNVIERFGVIKVMSKEHRPRPGVYVKAYIKNHSGAVEFYKDGYTDVRGKFDYVSLNTDKLSTIQKFAILVVDDELGSLVQEASPPPQ